MKLYYPIEVDLYKPYPLPIMEAQQNNIGRGALVTLKANGAIIQPTNEGLSFWAKKPDGTVSFLAATLTGSNVQLDFSNQMLAVPGMVQVEIRMTSGSGADTTDISTPIFSVRVNQSNINDDAPESTNEFTALVTALAEIEELKKNGLKGDPGEAATLEIGTVTASEPGSAPSVTNSGTAQEAILNFILPRGQTGPEGPAGQTQIHFSAASAFPATGDPAMLYVDNTVSPAIIYTWSGSAYVQASADISTVMAMLATPFSEAESYTAGKYVTYNGQYWRFTADKAAGAWDASKAEATNIGAELSALNASLKTSVSTYSGFTECLWGNYVQYSFYGRTWDFSTLPTPKGSHDLSFIVSLVGSTVALAHMVISAANGHVDLYSEPGWSQIPSNADIRIRGTIGYLIK